MHCVVRRLVAAVLVVAALLPPSRAAAAIPVLVVDGRGFGHGVGMAQDGTFWMAKAKAATPDILRHFYPGTTIGRGTGNVRVPVLSAAGGEVLLGFPDGGEVRDSKSGASSAGFPYPVPKGGIVRLRYDAGSGRYSVQRVDGVRGASASSGAESGTGETGTGDGTVEAAQQSSTTTSSTSTSTSSTSSSTTSTTAPPSTTTTFGFPTTSSAPPPTTPGGSTSTTAPPTTTTTSRPAPGAAPTGPSSARTLWAVPVGGGAVDVQARGRKYRGFIEAAASGAGLRLVNDVDVEVYLRGMGEVRDPSWPPAALRVQAIAARTYALRAMAAGGEICEDQRCQVYLGANAEYTAMNKAVSETAGQVVMFGRSFASTVYSANGGGFSASREEGFGTTGGAYPYLRPAPYQTSNPMPWTVRASLTDVAARLGYKGAVSAVEVAQYGPSGRALQVVLKGDAGDKVVTGIAFDRALALKSTLFTLRIEQSDVAPPPLAAGGVVQALPDDAASLAAAAPAPPSPDPGIAEAARAVPDLPGGAGPALAEVSASTGPRRLSTTAVFSALALVALCLLLLPRGAGGWTEVGSAVAGPAGRIGRTIARRRTRPRERPRFGADL